MKTLIKVTEQHIKKGKRLDCGYCPIAQAVREKFKIDYVRVAYERISVGANKSKENSKKIKSFINSFDMGQSVKPFNFILNYD